MGKNIAMIIAFREFRDEEYFIPKSMLESAGFGVVTVSDSLGTAIGKLGGEAEVDILLNDLAVKDYEAILFIGGAGAGKYIDDKTCHQAAKEVVEKNKILGAICVAPAILAKAGVLKGKKATVWGSLMDRSLVNILKQGGAQYVDKPVVVDKKIITASGPLAAEDFAKTIISLLK